MSLLKNSIWNIIGYAIPTLIAVPAFSYIARKIGVELFGLYTLLMMVIGYASIFDGGLTRAVVREIALNKNCSNECNSIIITAAVVVIVLGIVGGGTIILASDRLIDLLHVTDKYRSRLGISNFLRPRKTRLAEG